MHRILAIILIAAILPVSGGHPASAAAGFGSGLSTCASPYPPVTLVNPITVSGAQCTQAGIQAVLDQGGQILLDCGATFVAINSQLIFNPNVDTVLDGGGVTTLDGQNKTRILFKGWHDPAQHPSVTITVQNIRLVRGRAPSGSDGSGGAIEVGHPGTRLHVINASFDSNGTTDVYTPDNQGGAIFVHNAYETVLAGSLFNNNGAGNGGAFGGIATGLLIYNSVFTGNHAVDSTNDTAIVRGYGGAVALDGVYNDYNPNANKTVQVCGSRFEQNTAIRGGGAFSDVISDGAGTKAMFDRSTFSANEVTGIPGKGSSGQGGAIYHMEDDRVGGSGEDNFEIRDSTFSSNKVTFQGGAVWVSILGWGTVINSTFDGNTTTTPLNTVGQGGGMAIPSGNFHITNTLFSNNHAAYQGGALHGGGTDNQITLTNTIFYNNTLNVQTLPSETRWQGYHTNRTMLDGGQNIQYPRMKPDFNNDVNNLITNNPIFSDPLLFSLADNSGPTLTRALQAGSPAIDAGYAAACPAKDQRGYGRLGACDIGPFEYKGIGFVPSHWVYLAILRR